MKILEGDFLTVMLLFIAVLVIVLFPGKDSRTIHPMVNDLAVQPDQMLVKAKDYLADNQVCVAYVERAIESMRLLEEDADEESNLVIEAAIHDLQLLEKELLSNPADGERIDHAFLNALNSLAIAQIRESEEYLAEKNYAASKAAVKYATKHIECALQFSNANELLKEKEFEAQLTTLAFDHSIPDDQLVAKMEEVVEEMNAMVLH